MTSSAAISNMKSRGFRFNADGIPIVCPGPLSGSELPEDNPFGTFGMVFEDYELAYRYDRTLYIRYPSSQLVGDTLRYTLTYVFDLEGFPVLRDDGRTTDEVINEHWMTSTTWGSRLNKLRVVADNEKQWPVQWWKGGELVYQLTIGEIIDRFLDPARLEVQRVYLQAKMDALREETPAPLRPKEESDPLETVEVEVQPAVVVPEPQMVRAARGVKLSPQSDGSILAEREDAHPVRSTEPRVVWLRKKSNGFQHPHENKTVYPSGITRLALEHHSNDGGATLRGWGSDLGNETINEVEVEFQFNSKRIRFEAALTPEQVKEIL